MRWLAELPFGNDWSGLMRRASARPPTKTTKSATYQSAHFIEVAPTNRVSYFLPRITLTTFLSDIITHRMPSAASTTGKAVAAAGTEGMEGYLLKKNRLGIWSWRWAVLDRSSRPLTLSLYLKRRNSTEGRKAKETLQITSTTSITMPNHSSSLNRYFTVTSISTASDSGDSANDGKKKEQRWYFCAGSMQSLLVWKEKVDEAISDAKEHEMLSRVEVVDESNSDGSFGLSTISGGKYQAIKQIGKGSYGSVISALDRDRQTKVAIKKVNDVFDDLVDAKRVVREIRALRSLSHDNIVRLIDLPMPPAPGNFRDLYIVTELMEQDLYSVIYHHQKLSTDHIQFISYQILCALQYIHSADVYRLIACAVVFRHQHLKNLTLATCNVSFRFVRIPPQILVWQGASTPEVAIPRIGS